MDKKTQPTRSRAGTAVKSVAKYVGIGAIVYVTLFGLYSLFHFQTTKAKLLEYGLNASTAQLLAIVVMLLAIALPMMAIFRILAMRGRPLDYGVALVLPLISWGIAQLPARFSATTGEALQYCATRPGGKQFCLDREGFDPLTGAKLTPVTREGVIINQRRSLGLMPQRISAPFEQIQFFDTLSGEPVVWVAPSGDGCFEAFDNPGVHPAEGTALIPVTRELIAGMRQCISNRSQRAAQQKEAQRVAAEQAAAQVRAEQAAATRAARAAEIQSYRDKYSVRSGSKQSYAFTVVADGAIDGQSTAALARALGYGNTAPLLRQQAVEDGIFDRLFSGAAAEYTKLAVGEVSDRLVLATMNIEYSDNTAIRGATNAKASMRILVTNSRTASVVQETNLTSSALGYSNSEAREKAISEMIKSASDSLSL